MNTHTLRAAIAGFGMIVTETYRPLFEQLVLRPIRLVNGSSCSVLLSAVASRTGQRAEAYRKIAPLPLRSFTSFIGDDAAQLMLASHPDVVIVATPDDRHYSIASAALAVGKHVLIEKPSVLRLNELDTLQQLATRHGVLAKVVYHKLLDPDHKRLRTLVQDGHLRHVNSGYCTLLEPKSISSDQFSEWIRGRNPASYVAVHYIKLIDFTFGPNWHLSRISATGLRGLVDTPISKTWDAVHLQMVYVHPDGREAAFDIHTSWVMPDNFLGYVEQEVQFRFDNAIWNAHQRKRGVEVVIEDETPSKLKSNPNHHYNASFLEPWNSRSQRGYGIEVLERFFEEVAYVEFGGDPSERSTRYQEVTGLQYNDLSADRNTVAVVQALEAILDAQAEGHPGAIVKVNTDAGGLVLYRPGVAEGDILYSGRV